MQDPSLPQMALTVLMSDFLRYALAAGAVWLVVNVLLRRRLAGRRILDAVPAPGQVRREITYSLSTVLIFAANGLLLWLLIANGTVEVYPDVDRTRLGLVVGEPGADHRRPRRLVLLDPPRPAPPALVPHRARPPPRLAAPDAVGGLRLPPGRGAGAGRVPAAVPAASCPCMPGCSRIFLLHMILRNTIGHCAHELFPWRWTPRGWLGWITPVSHHHFHHARNRGNYGLYFTWWDRLCGTEDPEYLRYGDERFAAAVRREATA